MSGQGRVRLSAEPLLAWFETWCLRQKDRRKQGLPWPPGQVLASRPSSCATSRSPRCPRGISSEKSQYLLRVVVPHFLQHSLSLRSFGAGIPNGDHQERRDQREAGQHPKHQRPIAFGMVFQPADPRAGEDGAGGAKTHRQSRGHRGGFRMADIDRRGAAHQNIRAVNEETGQAEHGGGEDPLTLGNQRKDDADQRQAREHDGADRGAALAEPMVRSPAGGNRAQRTDHGDHDGRKGAAFDAAALVIGHVLHAPIQEGVTDRVHAEIAQAENPEDPVGQGDLQDMPRIFPVGGFVRGAGSGRSCRGGWLEIIVTNRGQAGILGCVAQEEVEHHGHGDQEQTGDPEARPPTQGLAKDAGEQPGGDIAHLVAGGNEAHHRAPALGGVPIGESLDQQRPAGGLGITVDGPQHQHDREGSREGKKQVGDRRHDQRRGHHAPGAIALSQGAVDDLPGGIEHGVHGGNPPDGGVGPGGELLEDERLGDGEVDAAKVV